ncbi:MAG: hypothetical protein PHZ24_14295, partial [Bacteroidales bacterium]|nr:hypothetical protein [Bacteroidales bacterium]
PTNYRGIIPYLGHTTKTSCNVGQVKLQSSEFLLGNDGKIATGEELIKLMTLIEGQQITVKWLDDNYYNVLKAYAFIGDRFICELIAKPVYHRAKVDQIPEDVIARELMSKYQMSIEGFANKRRKSIDKITVLETGFAPKKTSFKISELHPSEKKIESAAVAVMPDNLDFEDELNDFEPAYKQSLIDRF